MVRPNTAIGSDGKSKAISVGMSVVPAVQIHRNHRHQHQDGPKEGVKEELERGIDAVLTAPDADDQEHRDQTGFEEQVEQHQIQRAEHAQHQAFPASGTRSCIP
jgi:hypothetical protein